MNIGVPCRHGLAKEEEDGSSLLFSAYGTKKGLGLLFLSLRIIGRQHRASVNYPEKDTQEKREKNNRDILFLSHSIAKMHFKLVSRAGKAGVVYFFCHLDLLCSALFGILG